MVGVGDSQEELVGLESVQIVDSLVTMCAPTHDARIVEEAEDMLTKPPL